MASTNIIGDVRKGMEVHTMDGQKLGKVTEIWLGDDPTATSPLCDDTICSRLEVHYGFLGRNVLYIPYSAVREVASDHVVLNVNASAANEYPWNQKPTWIGS